jgi:hydrogenase maturation protease
MMRALVLACGNTLRGDDGVGWWIAGRVEQYFGSCDVEVEFVRQLTPELSDQVSCAELVIFVDCSSIVAPGDVSVLPVSPAELLPRILTHHLDPASLLRLSADLYGRIPDEAYVVAVGGESFELVETLTEPVTAAVPVAVELVGRILRSRKKGIPAVAETSVPAKPRQPMSWPVARR